MNELRRIRHERGLSQQRLANLANVDKVTIVHIENGKVSPKVETLEKLAGALGVELGDLFPKAQAPLFQELPDSAVEEDRRYSESGLEASKRALEPLTIGIRMLVETFGPMLDALPEPPLLEEYPRVRPLVEGTGPLNKTLTESGLVYDANELLAESKRGGPGAGDLGRKVRAFHTALSDLNVLAERAQEWGRRIPEIAERRERGGGDEDLDRALRKILDEETVPRTAEQLEAAEMSKERGSGGAG